MSEVRNVSFSHIELAELLIKHENIHEGHWCIGIEFILAAGNVAVTPDNLANILPAAIIPVKRIGIQRMDEPNALTVDAAVVNPRPKKGKE